MGQLGRATTAVRITDSIAKAIIRELSKSHAEAQVTKDRQADVYRAEVAQFEVAENRLYDRQYWWLA